MAWVEHVINHPRDEHGRLRLEPVEAAERPPLEIQRRILIRHKVPEHLVDLLAGQMAEQANQRAKRKRPKRR